MLVILVALVPFAIAVFVRHEREHRPHVAVGVVLGFLLFEAILLPGTSEVPKGILRFGVAGQDVRLAEVIVAAALFSRVWVWGLPRRVTSSGLLWTAFMLWYGSGALRGYLGGHSFQVIAFESRSLLFLTGGYVLVAGCDIRAVLQRATVNLWLGVIALVVAVVGPLTALKTFTDVDLGVQRFPDLGNYGASGRTMVAALAIIAFAVEACRPRPRPVLMGIAILLLLSPVAGPQRSAMLGSAVSGAVLFLTTWGGTWWKRTQVTGTQFALVLSALIGVAVLLLFVPSETSEDTPLLLENLDQTFFGDAQLQSADSRLRLGANARELIGEQPVIGWGFGKQVVLERPFGFDPVNVPAHNIVYDIGIRSGLLGIGLAAIALLASLADALRIWRGHDDPVIASFAMACAAALIGLLAKGLVESILENFRLATTLGMLLGGIAAARRSFDRTETEVPHRDIALHRRSAAAISRVLAL